MTYVTEQTSAELRAHMRRLQAIPGWHNPLDDRLFKEIQALDAEIAALRSPPTAITAEEAGREGDGWLPIETAPKDGTHILVSWPMRKMDDDGMPTGEITRRDTLVTWMNGNAWIEPDYLGASGEWYGDDDCYAVDPDLWQPLPPAPAQSGGQGNG